MPKRNLLTAGRFFMACCGLGAMAVGLTSGCASTPKRNWAATEHSIPMYDMQLAAGDELDIRFFGAPELNTQQVVRRDGKITLHLVGDIRVVGYSPQTVQQALQKLYEKQLQVTDIAVTISSPAPVYVNGAVLNPGPVRTVRPLTALEAIMATGGFQATQAKIGHVIVLRFEEQKWKAYDLNFEEVLAGETEDPFFLQPYDIVYVPRTKIVKVNQWVDQYINRMIPRLPFAIDSDGTATVFF